MTTIIVLIFAAIFFVGPTGAEEYTIVSETIPEQVVLNHIAAACTQFGGIATQKTAGDNNLACNYGNGRKKASSRLNVFTLADGGVRFYAHSVIHDGTTDDVAMAVSDKLADACRLYGGKIISAPILGEERQASVQSAADWGNSHGWSKEKIIHTADGARFTEFACSFEAPIDFTNIFRAHTTQYVVDGNIVVDMIGDIAGQDCYEEMVKAPVLVSAPPLTGSRSVEKPGRK